MIVLFEILFVGGIGIGVFAGVTSLVSSRLRNKRAFRLGKNLRPYDGYEFKASKRARESYLRGVRSDARLTVFGGDDWATSEDFSNLNPEARRAYEQARQEALNVLGDSYDQFR